MGGSEYPGPSIHHLSPSTRYSSWERAGNAHTLSVTSLADSTDERSSVRHLPLEGSVP